MHEEWEKGTEEPTHHVTPAWKVQWPSISNVCKWVKNTWQRVKSETIVKSLKKSGISNALDGSEDDLLYGESDAWNENKMILVAVTIFWVSMVNKLYHVC